ncbi:adenylate kinase 9-like [Pollicipes pollicipes]|uniref:adenylate kinase 9-like n=1 Tax=Pollicipes pollicipes TaxID=41117 RepID=UPI001884B6F0|nr:adenylate kinase 9-like [Pollicipes pollicipes]
MTWSQHEAPNPLLSEGEPSDPSTTDFNYAAYVRERAAVSKQYISVEERKPSMEPQDPFNMDAAEEQLLKKPPTSFIVIGKPGSGKTTTARLLAAWWRTIYISADDLVEDIIGNNSELGDRMRSLLTSGASVPEQLIVAMLSERLKQEDVLHYGYVLDGVPCLSEKVLSHLDQLKMSEFAYQLEAYKSRLMLLLEDYMTNHSPEFLIEIDATLAPRAAFESLKLRLAVLPVTRALVPVRLLEEGGEPPQVTAEDDPDEITHVLSHTNPICLRFKWTPSDFGVTCPVSMKQGRVVRGDPACAVGFLSHFYVMSGADTLAQFMQCPRRFLSGPPRLPCRVIVAPYLEEKRVQYREEKRQEKRQALAESFAEKRKAEQEEAERLKKEEEERLKTEEEERQKLQQEQGSEGQPDQSAAPKVEAALLEYGPELETLVQDVQLEPADWLRVLQETVAERERQRHAASEDTPAHGGWVIDNMPTEPALWSMMQQEKFEYDDLVCIWDDSDDFLFLQDYFYQEHKEQPPPSCPMMTAYKETLASFAQDWSAVRSLAEPRNCPEPIVLALDKVTRAGTTLLGIVNERMQKNFKMQARELTSDEQLEHDFGDVDDEVEEDEAEAVEEEDFVEEEIKDEASEDIEEARSDLKRLYGETGKFCPVVYSQFGVAQPGRRDFAVGYRGQLYLTSSQEAMDALVAEPERYIPRDACPAPPPLRLVLLGAYGSGKSGRAQHLAESCGVFCIDYRERLQELMQLLGRPRLGKHSKIEVAGEGAIAEDIQDVLAETVEVEAYLQEELPSLSPDSLDEIVREWWEKEPFKSVGFVLEGFPATPDDLSYLTERHLFPDAFVVLVTDPEQTVERLLKGCMEEWERQMDAFKASLNKAQEEKASERLREIEERRKELAEDIEAKKKQREEERLLQLQQAAAEEGDEEGDLTDDEPPEGSDALTLGEEGGEEEEEVDIEQIISDEFPEIEDNELSWETKEEAKERISDILRQWHEDDTQALEALREVAKEANIPWLEVDARKRGHIVDYTLAKAVEKYTKYRVGLMQRAYPIGTNMAARLLDTGYRQLSKFGKQCPVTLLERGLMMPPFNPTQKRPYPVIFRRHIYYCVNSDALDKFVANPTMYTAQKAPLYLIPSRVAVLGPPKSGKTAVSCGLVARYGLQRVSPGEALADQYRRLHDNVVTADADASLWAVENTAREALEERLRGIYRYRECTAAGRAAPVGALCITPDELAVRLGPYRHYCPVCWRQGRLVDLSADRRLAHTVELQARFYRTYVTGGHRYEALVAGSDKLAVGYLQQVYLCASEDAREKFMQEPRRYCACLRDDVERFTTLLDRPKEEIYQGDC